MALPALGAAGDTVELLGVSCPTASMCMAIGADSNSSAQSGIALLWNGIAWSVATPPSDGASAVGNFSAVACPTSAFCMTIASGDGSQPTRFAESWTNGTWKVLDATLTGNASAIGNSPSTASADIKAASCTSVADCTAVGYDGGAANQTSAVPIVAHWDGSAWTIAYNQIGDGLTNIWFRSISCFAEGHCMAVGYQQKQTADEAEIQIPAAYATLGTTATETRVPLPGSSTTGVFSSVSCKGTECTAVGTAYTPMAPATPLAERYLP